MTENDKVWFDNIAVGQHTIGSMMATLSENAKLSRRYTNHCLRATTVTVLDEAGTEARHIVAVTHHASTASLSSYSRVSDNRMKKMSSVISTALTGKPTSSDRPIPAAASAPTTAPLPDPVPDPVPNPAPVLPLSPSLDLFDGFDFDDLELNVPNTENIQTQHNRSVFQPIFNNCKVNINYNLK